MLAIEGPCDWHFDDRLISIDNREIQNLQTLIARMAARDPLPLSVALSELIALRGFARIRSDNELEAAWKTVAGPEIAGQSRPLQVSRGSLTISVENAPLLSELASFEGPRLLEKIKQQFPHLKIKTLKFKLSGT